MQINLRWHPEAFVNAAQGFDPAVNVDYAARFLTDLTARPATGWRPPGPTTPHAGAARGLPASLRRNVAVANARIDDFLALAGGALARRAVTVRAGRRRPTGGAIWSVAAGGLSW